MFYFNFLMQIIQQKLYLSSNTEKLFSFLNSLVSKIDFIYIITWDHYKSNKIYYFQDSIQDILKFLKIIENRNLNNQWGPHHNTLSKNNVRSMIYEYCDEKKIEPPKCLANYNTTMQKLNVEIKKFIINDEYYYNKKINFKCIEELFFKLILNQHEKLFIKTIKDLESV